jgi:hypothetical protein
MVALAGTITAPAGASTRDVDPAGGGDGPGRRPDRRDRVGAGGVRVGVAAAALPEHLAGELVEILDLADEQLQHLGGVLALTTERGDRLASDPERCHPAS